LAERKSPLQSAFSVFRIRGCRGFSPVLYAEPDVMALSGIFADRIRSLFLAEKRTSLISVWNVR
jgi:hypothetical protein